MSGSTRGATARLLVQLSAHSAPAVQRHCPRCKLTRGFVSSGKFRVNAQKKRIDAWLIFRCTVCDDRWNWPVHARRPVGALDPAELDALMRNDPALAARHAAVALRMGASAPQATHGPSVTLTVVEPATADTAAIEIVVAVTGAGLRLDRLLAQALALGRREIEALDRGAAIAVRPAARKALRRPAGDGQEIRIDLANCGTATAERLRRRFRSQPPALYCATLSPR